MDIKKYACSSRTQIFKDFEKSLALQTSLQDPSHTAMYRPDSEETVLS